MEIPKTHNHALTPIDDRNPENQAKPGDGIVEVMEVFNDGDKIVLRDERGMLV